MLLTAAPAAMAGPVICTTSLEAPRADRPAVSISRCGPVQTVPELIQAGFYTYTSPFEQRVGLSQQITDLLGITPPGRGGQRRLGFGFPDQTIVYDGVALENTTAFLLDAQSNPLPLRTPDIDACYSSSLEGSFCGRNSR